MVTVDTKVTTQTIERSYGQSHLLPVPAARASLRCVSGVYFNQRTTSVFSFVRKIVKELPPCHIENAFGKAVVVNHPVNVQVFNGDDTSLVDKVPAKLVSEVGTPVCSTLLDMRNDFASLGSLRRPLRLFTHSSLSFSKSLFSGTKETGIVDDLARRKSGETRKSDINTHSFFRFWKRIIGDFTAKRHEPLASAGTSDTAGLDVPFEGAVVNNLNIANLGKRNGRIANGIPALWVTKAIIPSSAAETGVSRLLARFNSAEESLKSKVNPDSHVLENLTVDTGKRWSIPFQGRQSLNLSVESKGLVVIFPSYLTLFQKVIVKPATLVECLEHKSLLFVGRIQSVLESYLMHNVNYSTNVKKEKAREGFAVCIPAMNGGVLAGSS